MRLRKLIYLVTRVELVSVFQQSTHTHPPYVTIKRGNGMYNATSLPLLTSSHYLSPTILS